jgi:iron complex transport system ATP-binding protein
VARGVAVTLGGRPALRGVDLDARPGEVTVIVGPNGSGKTTLLRAVAGEIAHAGSVTLGGQDVAAARPWQMARLRAVLPQETALAFPFTALEVVRLGLAAGVHAARGRIASEALSRVGLAGFEGRLVQEFSGGERQRVQLARVLAQVWEPVADGEPRWLMLDEPVAGLDLAHQLLVMRIARDFAAAGGGVLAVLHDLNLTAMAAHHVLLLRDGRALVAGPPEDVLTDATLSEAYACTVRVGVAPHGVFLLPQVAAIG